VGGLVRACAWYGTRPAASTGILLRCVASKQHPPRTNLVHCHHTSAPIWCSMVVSTHSLPGAPMWCIVILQCNK